MLLSLCGNSASMYAVVIVFLFFKQKTAYEMRISDWSSDVCSSDLPDADLRRRRDDRPGTVLLDVRRRCQGRRPRGAAGTPQPRLRPRLGRRFDRDRKSVV